MIERADNQPAENIDEQNQNTGGRVAAYEFTGAVHGTIEICFFANFVAASSRFVLSRNAGVQVGVDRHLLAGHGVESESRADLRDSARTFGYDDEVDDDEDRKHDETDRVVSAYDEAPKASITFPAASGPV